MKFNLKPRLAVIFLQYDSEKYPRAFEQLKMCLKKLIPKQVIVVLVNNRDEGDGSRRLDEKTTYLQGNNADWEFSGWQKGVNYLQENGVEYDVGLLVDDAFEAGGPSYLRNHNLRWLVLKCHVLNVVLGEITTLWDRSIIDGGSARIWIKTGCFFVPRAILSRLGTLVSVDETSLNKYLPEKFPGRADPFESDAPINAEYRKHIVTWLTERWHSKFALTETSWIFFRAKVKAILNEALLSIRIREMGFIIMPCDIPVFIFTKLRGAIRRVRRIAAFKNEQIV